ILVFSSLRTRVQKVSSDRAKPPPGFTKATKKIWLPFLRPGKPLAQTGVEIGDSQSEACHGVVVQSTPKPG
ncbi:MAG: hypothetical protein IKB41_00250, partial [Clostridia bacterium]|nr:hypothetical protein [Clostridia bacterium]